MEPLTKQNSQAWLFGGLIVLALAALTSLLRWKNVTIELPPVRNSRTETLANTVATVWDLRSGQKIQTLKGHNIPARLATAVACSPDGNTILTGSVGDDLRLWDVSTGLEVRVFHNPSGYGSILTSLSFSSDGKRFLVGRKGGPFLANKSRDRETREGGWIP